MNHSNSLSQPDGNEQKTRLGPGFFDMSLKRLKEIAEQGLGPDAAAAMIVAAAGVNSAEKAMPRACTHGAQSVSVRTTMSETRASIALKNLVEAKFLQVPPSPPADPLQVEPPRILGPTAVRYLVDPDHARDVAISQDFVQAAVGARPELVCKRATLAHVFNNIWIGDDADIPAHNAIVDALLTFLALHRKQEFEIFAGVDPKVACGRFSPLSEGEGGDDTSHLRKIAGVPDWILRTMRAPKELLIDSTFIRDTLGTVPEWDGAPSLERRMKVAIAQLVRSGLVYRAHVVWNSDPLLVRKGSFSWPLFTLYAGAGRDKVRELQLQDAVHTALLKAQIEDSADVWGDSRGESPRYAGTGIFQYLVPRQTATKATLLTQFRVRRWPGNEATFGALECDSQRVRKWEAKLREITTVSLMRFQECRQHQVGVSCTDTA